MSESPRLDGLPKEDRTPEIEAVLEGRDDIELEPELLVEKRPAESPGDPRVREEALAVRLRRLPVPARVKLALTGGKDARQILARDPVKLVQHCVLRNNRFTLDEALAMAKNRSLHGELLRVIAEERDWVRQYSIRLALVTNPKTPLQVGLGLLSGIQERDMRIIARSKNVPTVLQAQARRVILRRDTGKPKE